MKKILSIFYTLGFLFVFFSCGEDRSSAYYALTSGNRWIDDVMDKYYLWNENVGTASESDYFKNADAYLALKVYKGALNGKGDSFSYIEWKDSVNTRININRTSGYGFEFEVLTDPLGTTTHTLARVLYVMPNSPASEAGIERGDWISAVGGKQLTVNNYKQLIAGEATTLARTEVITSEDDVQTWSPVDTISIGQARFVELNPFFLDSVYTVDNHKIAYMVYNQFSTGPYDLSSETEYGDQMLLLFNKFKAQSPDAFILDLRYNTGGYLQCAEELGSLLVPESALGQPFCTLQRNGSAYTEDETYTLNSKYASANLNLSKLYVLTSCYTASASEAIINCLMPYFGEGNIIVIGETTYGKPVGMQPFEDDEHDFIIWPVTAYILNAEGNADYADGITPDYSLSERKLTSHLYPLGDAQEHLLKNTIHLITTGSIMDTQSNRIMNNPKVLQTSLNKRKKLGIIIP